MVHPIEATLVPHFMWDFSLLCLSKPSQLLHLTNMLSLNDYNLYSLSFNRLATFLTKSHMTLHFSFPQLTLHFCFHFIVFLLSAASVCNIWISGVLLHWFCVLWLGLVSWLVWICLGYCVSFVFGWHILFNLITNNLYSIFSETLGSGLGYNDGSCNCHCLQWLGSWFRVSCSHKLSGI